MFQLNMRLNFSKFDKSRFKKQLKKLTPNKRHHFLQHPRENVGARMLYQLAFIENELLITEGLHAKRVYIGFWPIFIFCRIKLIFDMASLVMK